MFGFGKKKTKKPEKVSKNIQVIPEEFYGAKDPSIHYETNNKFKTNKSIELKGRPSLTKNSLGGVSEMFNNKKIKYSLIIFLFLISTGLISWYYIDQARPKSIPVAVEEKEESVIMPPVEVEEEEVVVEEEPVVEEIKVEEEVPILVDTDDEPVLIFPSIILTDSPDADNDSLTDLEEELFNTDSGTWDTDGDGYYDGQEVFNLYNPTGLAPMKLVDAGLVQEYVNPVWQYRVYFPVGWSMGEVDSSGRQVLFSSIYGDYIEIFVAEKDSNVSFAGWFGKEAVGQKFSDLQKFTNRFKEDGWKRKDNLTAYFVSDEQIYVMIYHTGSSEFLSFRHIMQVMAQSFRPTKTILDIPEQTVLPSETNLIDITNLSSDSFTTTTDSIDDGVIILDDN